MDCRRAREQLSALVDNALSPSDHASLLEHLKQCRACQHEWQSLQVVTRMVRSLPEMNPPSDFRMQLFERIQNETKTPMKQTRIGLRSRWYQWSIAAAAVLMLVWSARFVSVKPTPPRPNEIGTSTDVDQSSIADSKLQKTPLVTADPAPMAPHLQEDHTIQGSVALLTIQDPTPTAKPMDAIVQGTGLEDFDEVQSVAMSGTSLAGAVNSMDLPNGSSQVDQPTQPITEEIATIQTTPNPSFTVTRNSLDGDRHRDDSLKSAGSSGQTVFTRFEETITKLRISGPGPDELRKYLRNLASNHRLEVKEQTPAKRVAHFSVRGSSEQINRLLTQVSTFVTIVERETVVVDLRPAWNSIQEEISRLRLEIGRREELIRQTKTNQQIEMQEIELREARVQLQNYEQEIRLLEDRLETSLLEIGY